MNRTSGDPRPVTRISGDSRPVNRIRSAEFPRIYRPPCKISGVNGRHLVLGVATLIAFATAFATPRIAQPAAYHRMADERTIAGIPNALNVVSNLPFAVVGLIGLMTLRDEKRAIPDMRDRWPYVALFGGVFLTAICSSYYHLAPDNARLVWDRLPMTVGFMGSARGSGVGASRPTCRSRAACPAAHRGRGVGPLLGLDRGEGRGRSEALFSRAVRFIAARRVDPRAVSVVGSDTRYIVGGLLVYVLAKIFEVADAQIFATGGFVSGHTLKHLVAAAGVWCLVLMVRERATGPSQCQLARSSSA